MQIPVTQISTRPVAVPGERISTPVLFFGLPLLLATILVSAHGLSPGVAPASQNYTQPQPIAYNGSIVPAQTSPNNPPSSSSSSSSQSPSNSAPATSSSSASFYPASSKPANSSSTQALSGGRGGGAATTSSTSPSSTPTTSGSTGPTLTVPSTDLSAGSKPILSTSPLNLTIN